MNRINFGDPLTFHFAASSGQIIVQKNPTSIKCTSFSANYYKQKHANKLN